MSHQRGFTLIQMMVTIMLMGIISMMASPITGAFTSDAKVTSAEAALNKAVGKAKAIALRNELGSRGETPVVAICISQTKVMTLEVGATDQSPNCSTADGVVVWTTTLAGNVSIKTNEAGSDVETACLCFGNNGLLTTGACATTACATSTAFLIESGSSSELVSIF